MLSKSLRSVLFFVVVAGMLSVGYFQTNAKAQASADKTYLVGSAPALLIGPVYTQPIDPAGKFFQSSWLDPNGSDYDQYVWDNFAFQSDQTIIEIDWIGGYDPAKFGSGGPVLDFSVKIYPSIAGGSQPDVVNPPLVQYQTGGKAGETSIGPVGGKTMYSYGYALPTPFTAMAGVKYWIQIEAFQQGVPDWGIAGGTGGDRGYFRKIVSPGGDGLYQIMSGDTAFTLLGSLANTMTPTPTGSVIPPTQTDTPTMPPTNTPTPTSTDTPTATPTDTPLPTSTPTNTPTPTLTDTPNPQPSTPGQVFGNGRTGWGWWFHKTFFQFWVSYRNGDTSPKGSFIYLDREAHLFLVATSFDQLVIDGTTAKFSGLATVNGQKNVWFEINVIDSREHDFEDKSNDNDSIDNFTIKIPSLDGYSTGKTFVGRNITIHVFGKPTLTVTANNQSISAGSPDPAFTFEYSGFINGDAANVVTAAPVCNVPVPHTIAGTYDIVCSGGVAPRYSFNYVNGTLTVTAVNLAPIFADVPFNHSVSNYIERLYNAGIASGCATAPLSYCPDASVTRAQMAVFLLKGIYGSSYTPPAVGANTGFTDVPVDYWASAWIKQLAAEGITSGCGNGIYCPDAAVTRAQMAVFLLRARYDSTYSPPAASGTAFGDVPFGSFADAWIEQLVLEGITTGCGEGSYCPDAGVTRAQMAVFMVKTFSLP